MYANKGGKYVLLVKLIIYNTRVSVISMKTKITITFAPISCKLIKLLTNPILGVWILCRSVQPIVSRWINLTIVSISPSTTDNIIQQPTSEGTKLDLSLLF